MEKVRFGVVGLGDRGYGLLRDVLVKMDEVEIVAVCDVFDDRVQQALELVQKEKGTTPVGYSRHEELLDDSNVDRFANYLGKLTDHTQFILITHRRGTMLRADRLYGITMQEKGVSTLVSVNLTDAEGGEA